MTIARQLELTLIGDAAEKSGIIEGLQGLGVVHLVPLEGGAAEVGPDAADDARAALNDLQGCPRKRRPQRPIGETDLQTVVEDILRNKYRREDAIDRIEVIEQRLRALRPWGNFSLPAVEELDSHRLWFYLVPRGKESGLGEIRLPWQIVNSDQRYHYLVILSEWEPEEQAIPFRRVHTGSRSLEALEEQLYDTRVELEDLEADRESFTRWIPTLRNSLYRILDRRDQLLAEQQCLTAEEVFVVRGWIPRHCVEALSRWIESVPAGYTLREPDADDTPPTLLINSDRFGGGQEAVSFFQLPGYSNWDPSPLIFASFSLFFAMILADAGYGLVLGLPLLVYWRRLSIPGTTAIRLRNMWLSLSLCSVLYGVAVGSYFGVGPPAGSALAALYVLDLNDFDSMMRLSIAVGTLHLMMAHAAVFWSSRGTRAGMVALAWFIGVGSGFGLWLHYITASDFSLAASPFSYGLLAWLLLLLLFSGERPFDSAKNIGLNLASGLGALTGLTKAFGDVLSYMRLFALGLAGTSLAATFNELAVTARDASPNIGFLYFILIILLGHTLNFALALMSGVIHGLRLNLMEFYNWGIRDEGYPFKAFAKRGVSKWTNS